MWDGKDESQGISPRYDEKSMKYCPVGYHLVMNSTTIAPSDRTHIAIEYKYKSWKLLVLIFIEGYGITGPGDIYISHFHSNCSNFLFPLLLVPTCFEYISMPVIK